MVVVADDNDPPMLPLPLTVSVSEVNPSVTVMPLLKVVGLAKLASA